MGKFTKYRSFYKEPERYTPDIARERRLTAVLKKEQEAAVIGALSRAKERERFIPRWKLEEAPSRKGPKAASIAAALATYSERDFADPAKRQEYRRLRSMQIGLNARRDQQRAKPAGADMRQSGFDTGWRTVFGTVARLQNELGSRWLPGFKHINSVIPCIERVVRREVMFAKGHAGRGYRVKHRRTIYSGVPC